MKQETAIKAVLVVAAGFAVGYAVRHLGSADETDTAPEPSASRVVPTLHFSSRPGAKAAAVETDGREKRRGAELHFDAKKTCDADEKCQYATCSRACSEWIGASYSAKDFASVRVEQQVFINCVGYCLDPLELREGAAAASAR